MWVTPYLEEDLSALADLIGVERILFGSDWPHGEGVAQPLDFEKELGGFDEAARAADHARQLPRAARDRGVSDVTRRERRDRTPSSGTRSTAGSTRNWDPDLTVDEWWKTVADAGWTAPHFTAEQGGRGLRRRSPGRRAVGLRRRTARCARPAGSAC